MKRLLVLSLFLLAKFVLSYALVNPVYELHRDEFLHLDQANHPAWGYLSVPPVTSWVALLIKALGNGLFWVRFFPALFGSLTLLVVWKATEKLGGSLFALVLAAVSVLFSALLRLNMLFQPNSLDVLLWTWLYYLVMRHVQTANPKYVWLSALALGFGLLNKYNMLFLIAGLAPALLLSSHRRIFRERQFRGAAALALVLVLPNLAWQYVNGFPVIHHMSQLAQSQLANVNRADFLKDQLLFFMGSIHVLIASVVGLLLYKPFRPYRFFLWSFAFTLAVFALLRAKSYYAIGLYPFMIAFGSVVLERRLAGKAGIVLRGAAIAFVVGFFVSIHKLAFPMENPEAVKRRMLENPELGLSRWEDGKTHDIPQDYADMLGWQELARITDASLESLPKNTHTIILCDNYGQAGAINYYSRHKSVRAVTMNADYVNWFPLKDRIQNVVLVQESDDDDPQRTRERAFFESVMKTGEVKNPYAREKGTSVYVLRSARIDVNAILRSEILAEKNRWK